MPSRNFDERYPAMFQPGGEADGTADWAPATGSAGPIPPMHEQRGHQATAPEPGRGLAGPHAAEPGDAATFLHGEQASAAGGSVAPGPWPLRLWLGPLAAALAMLAGGVFAMTAQYWVPSAMTIDPSNFGGVDLQPWGYAAMDAAPPLFLAGSGILAGLLFLASRRSAGREPALRRSFGVLAAALGVAGWVGMFAVAMFPQALSQWTSSNNNGRPSPMPWTYVVGGSGMWLFMLALAMAAVLIVLPPRRQEAGTRRGLLYGAALAGAGTFALFAPYLYPTATGTVVVQLSGGGQATRQGWAALAPGLAIPLLMVGFAVIGWALLAFATTPRRSPEADGGPSAVEPESMEA